MVDAALLPEDSDVADERKRVFECQPVLESMMGSPLILQELSKVNIAQPHCLVKCKMETEKKLRLILFFRFTLVAVIFLQWTDCLWLWVKESVLVFWASMELARPQHLKC